MPTEKQNSDWSLKKNCIQYEFMFFWHVDLGCNFIPVGFRWIWSQTLSIYFSRGQVSNKWVEIYCEIRVWEPTSSYQRKCMWPNQLLNFKQGTICLRWSFATLFPKSSGYSADFFNSFPPVLMWRCDPWGTINFTRINVLVHLTCMCSSSW